MTASVLIAFLTALLTETPQLINEVDKLIQDFKGSGPKPAAMKPEVDAAMAGVAAELTAAPPVGS